MAALLMTEFIIDWGDGQRSTDVELVISNGVFQVRANHTYKREGSYVATVQLYDALPNNDINITAGFSAAFVYVVDIIPEEELRA